MWWVSCCRGLLHFNPHPPWGGRLSSSFTDALTESFQSTPSVGRATRYNILVRCNRLISIHALRGEGDLDTLNRSIRVLRFQSTPSVGRATLFMCFEKIVSVIFQSTPSVGRATKWTYPKTGGAKFQSTPSVGRATKIAIPIRKRGVISIHALRGEGDYQGAGNNSDAEKFQSTPSVGRATGKLSVDTATSAISIHALRGEGDSSRCSSVSPLIDFNPRPPWGGRLRNRRRVVHIEHFNPRPPWGGRPLLAFNRSG